MKILINTLALATLSLTSQQALAWGSTGHRTIGLVADGRPTARVKA